MLVDSHPLTTHSSCFKVVLVILEVLGLFLSFYRFWGYFGQIKWFKGFFLDILWFWGYFGNFCGYIGHSSDFKGIFVKISHTNNKKKIYLWELQKYQNTFKYPKTSKMIKISSKPLKMTKIQHECPKYPKNLENDKNAPKTNKTTTTPSQNF